MEEGEVIFYPYEDQHKFEFALADIKRSVLLPCCLCVRGR
jgi:hypothetical protein